MKLSLKHFINFFAIPTFSSSYDFLLTIFFLQLSFIFHNSDIFFFFLNVMFIFLRFYRRKSKLWEKIRNYLYLIFYYPWCKQASINFCLWSMLKTVVLPNIFMMHLIFQDSQMNIKFKIAASICDISLHYTCDLCSVERVCNGLCCSCVKPSRARWRWRAWRFVRRWRVSETAAPAAQAAKVKPLNSTNSGIVTPASAFPENTSPTPPTRTTSLSDPRGR